MTGPERGRPAIAGQSGHLSRSAEQGVVSHYNIQPVIDVYGDVQGRDLGSVAKELSKIVANAEKNLPARQLDHRARAG